jgi:hypothetical protein
MTIVGAEGLPGKIGWEEVDVVPVVPAVRDGS